MYFCDAFELMYRIYFFSNVKNNSDCAPFEESLTQPQDEEPPKTLLEVRLTDNNY